MKILYLITKSNFGGAQKYTYELAVGAAQAGHEVVVACGGTGSAGAPTGELVTRLEAAGIRTVYVSHFLRDIAWHQEFAAAAELFRIFQQERPQVVHLSSSKAGGIGSLVARLARVPRIIFTIHGLPADESWRPRWQRVLIHLLTWCTILLTQVTIVLTAETKDRLAQWPGVRNKLRHIPNGIQTPAFLSRTAARTALGLPEKVFCLGGIGELHPNKNWSTAIATLATLPEDVHFCLIGTGEEAALLQQECLRLDVSDRVHVVGYKKDAAQYLTAFDVVILPSKKEGLPYVLLEAGLAERPVVASRLPGIEAIITTGETGLLVSPTVTDLGTAITMLLRDAGMRTRLGTALREQVETHFSPTKMLARTLASYASSKGSTARIDA